MRIFGVSGVPWARKPFRKVKKCRISVIGRIHSDRGPLLVAWGRSGTKAQAKHLAPSDGREHSPREQGSSLGGGSKVLPREEQLLPLTYISCLHTCHGLSRVFSCRAIRHFHSKSPRISRPFVALSQFQSTDSDITMSCDSVHRSHHLWQTNAWRFAHLMSRLIRCWRFAINRLLITQAMYAWR